MVAGTDNSFLIFSAGRASVVQYRDDDIRNHDPSKPHLGDRKMEIQHFQIDIKGISGIIDDIREPQQAKDKKQHVQNDKALPDKVHEITFQRSITNINQNWEYEECHLKKCELLCLPKQNYQAKDGI